MPSRSTLLLLVIAVVLMAVVEGARRRRGTTFVPHAENPIISLVDATNFRDKVLMTSQPVVLLLYKTEDESSSKALATVMDSVSSEFKDLFQFGFVDSSSESGQQLLSSFSVSQYPGIVLFNSDMHAVPGVTAIN